MIVPGGIPTWPLPAKITVELCEPIDWASRYGPEAAEDEAIVRECYEELTATMQATLDRLAGGAPLSDPRIAGRRALTGTEQPRQ